MEEYFLALVGGETRGRRWLRYLPQHEFPETGSRSPFLPAAGPSWPFDCHRRSQDPRRTYATSSSPSMSTSGSCGLYQV